MTLVDADAGLSIINNNGKIILNGSSLGTRLKLYIPDIQSMSKLKCEHCFNKNDYQLRLAQMVSEVSVGNPRTMSFPSTPPGGR